MKKVFLVFLGLTTAHLSFASIPIDLGFGASCTPYDRYMNSVKDVLTRLDGQGPSLLRVRDLMRKGRSFRYSFIDPYLAALPNVTSYTHTGDCKAKALWLADQLNDPSVRFVIG